MPSNCCVPGCSGTDGHPFPTDKFLRLEWRFKIDRMENNELFIPSPSSVVCDGHFVKTDYVDTALGKTLRQNAVPSVFCCRPYRPTCQHGNHVPMQQIPTIDLEESEVSKGRTSRRRRTMGTQTSMPEGTEEVVDVSRVLEQKRPTPHIVKSSMLVSKPSTDEIVTRTTAVKVERVEHEDCIEIDSSPERSPRPVLRVRQYHGASSLRRVPPSSIRMPCRPLCISSGLQTTTAKSNVRCAVSVLSTKPSPSVSVPASNDAALNRPEVSRVPVTLNRRDDTREAPSTTEICVERIPTGHDVAKVFKSLTENQLLGGSSYRKFCGAKNCYNTKAGQPDLTFFKFPKEENLCRLWTVACGRSDLDVSRCRNAVLCSEHFESSQFVNSARNRLIPRAVPRVFGGRVADLPPGFEDCIEEHQLLIFNFVKPAPKNQGLLCSVATCSSTGEDDVYFYRFPEDPTLASKWLKYVADRQEEYISRSHICENHFDENCVKMNKEGEKLLLRSAVPFDPNANKPLSDITNNIQSKWTCPCCCEKSFQSRQDLRTHLQRISEALKCPICDKLFSSLKLLVAHLRGKCTDQERPAGAVSDPANGDDDVRVVEQCCSRAEDDDVSVVDTVPSEPQRLEPTVQNKRKRCRSREKNSPAKTRRKREGVRKSSAKSRDSLPTMTCVSKSTDESAANDNLCVESTESLLHMEPASLSTDELIAKEPAASADDAPSASVENGHNYCYSGEKKSRLQGTSKPRRVLPYVRTCCDKVFKSRGSFRYHWRACHTGRKFACTQCPKIFYTNYLLTLHLRWHNNDRPYLCEICCKAYTRLKYLRQHQVCHSGKKYQCNICDREFLHPTYLKQHIEKVHMKDPEQFQCKTCSTFCKTKKALQRHLYEIHQIGGKPRSPWFSKSLDVFTPRELSERRANEDFACRTCGLASKSMSSLKQHMVIKHNAGNKEVPCEYCSKVFKSRSAYSFHLRVAHEKRYRCDLCNRRFHQQHHVIAHLTLHMHNPSQLKHVCNLCGAAFGQKPWLERHLQQEHVTNTEALEHTKSVVSMDLSHLKNVDETFPCHLCNKVFRTKMYLTLHMRIHSKPVSCEVCGDRFPFQSTLRAHMNKVHLQHVLLTNSEYDQTDPLQ